MRPIRISIPAKTGSFHHEAATTYFGEHTTLIHETNMKEALHSVINNAADYAVLACENTSVGFFYETFRLVSESGLFLIDEVYVQVKLCLAVNARTQLNGIRRVLSHPYALMQVNEKLVALGLDQHSVTGDTTLAADKVRDHPGEHLACVCNERIAQDRNLNILFSNIQKAEHNYTRFFIIGKGCQLHAAFDKVVGISEPTLVDGNVPGVCLIRGKKKSGSVFRSACSGRNQFSTAHTSQKQDQKDSWSCRDKKTQRKSKTSHSHFTMNKILIAGPCSAESPEQMINIANMISLINDRTILRAGCWKPRTNPGFFEGHGEVALKWLKTAAEFNGLEWMTECGTAGHAEVILRNEGKILWIGARTTGDPFAVESIARTLEGSKMKIWIKNPPQPDLKLWLGAAERFTKRGIEVAGFIHRGFKIWPGGNLRNDPCWSLIRKLKSEIKDIPVITDPSHMAGKKNLVEKISIDAAVHETDGWMIEAHPQPENALTDKEQQLSPVELMQLWNKLETVPRGDRLSQLRSEIDELDSMLWNVLRERLKRSKEIGEVKSQSGTEVVQVERMKAVAKNYKRLAQLSGMTCEDGKEIFRLVHKSSVGIQHQINSGSTEAIS